MFTLETRCLIVSIYSTFLKNKELLSETTFLACFDILRAVFLYTSLLECC
jgi:hypothetical protein